MDQWKFDELSKRVIATRPAAQVWLEAWSKAWPWAKTVVEGEVEVPCAKSRAEVWTRAEAKAWEIADAAAADAEKRQPLSGVKPWEAKMVKGWEARRLKAAFHSPMAQALVEALALVGVLGWACRWEEERARGEKIPAALADPSTIRDILSFHNRSGLARDLWHRSRKTRDEYSCLIHFIAPITRLPHELLQQIFLIIIDETSGPPSASMLVCKHWHAIVTSIWASLNLRTRTPVDAVARKLERNQWLLDIRVDTDSDRGDFTPSDDAFDAIFAAIEVSSRWRSFVVESFPAKADLPEDLVNHRLQRCSNGAMNRFTIFKIKSACEKSPLLDGLLHILGTTSRVLITVEINSANVISFLAPAYPFMFHSIKVLSLDTPGIPNPVDLLPHLHQLETFTASHISFPIYHNDVNLPFINTLCHLSLRAASIQWMSGRTFPILEDCTIIFPLHQHVLYTFRTNLPNCTNLTFRGYPLHILGGVSAHKLAHLSVASSGSFNRRGSRQLVWLSRHVLEQTRLTPKILHIGIEATNEVWVNALGFMSNLEELVIYNAQPCSLKAKVLQSLIIQPVHSIIPGAPSIPGESEAPLCPVLCPVLQRFGLKYDRWLRPTEKFDLISVFESIIQSRQRSNRSLKMFSLWITGYQKGPLELIEGSQLSVRGFDRLRGLIPSKMEWFWDEFPVRYSGRWPWMRRSWD